VEIANELGGLRERLVVQCLKANKTSLEEPPTSLTII